MFRRPLKKTHKAVSGKTGLSRRTASYPDRNRETRPAGTRYALPGTEKNSNRNLDAVRQREPHIPHVRFIDGDGLAQLAHAARLLRAEQVAHAGMPAHEFAGRGLFEALGSAAVRLQLHFLVLLHNSLFKS